MIKILPLCLEYCEKVTQIAEESLPESWSLKEMQNVLQYDYNLYYVACDLETGEKVVSPYGMAKRIVGFAGAMMIDGDAELLNIAVRKSCRRQGVGTALLETLLDEVKRRGMNRMLLEVRKSNLAAQHLYGRHGFIQIAVRERYYKNPTEDAMIMECMLCTNP